MPEHDGARGDARKREAEAAKARQGLGQKLGQLRAELASLRQSYDDQRETYLAVRELMHQRIQELAAERDRYHRERNELAAALVELKATTDPRHPRGSSDFEE